LLHCFNDKLLLHASTLLIVGAVLKVNRSYFHCIQCLVTFALIFHSITSCGNYIVFWHQLHSLFTVYCDCDNCVLINNQVIESNC
jgi:hypothetical protein